MTDLQTLKLFEDTGAYLRGHFRLTSGLHSTEYLQCALVLQHPAYASRLGQALAVALQKRAERPVQFVIAPAMGGLIIGHEVARALDVRFIFTERDPSTREMQLRRGFVIQPGESGAVIEDVITTGGSSREVADIVHHQAGNVVVAGSIIDRSGGAADIGVERAALATMSVLTFPEDQCPMCREGIPVTKPGSRPT